MRGRTLPVAALALGVWLLTDVLRVWLPSIITIFGQAASTPAELMGGFALLWFVAAFAGTPLLRFAGPRRVAVAAGVVLAGCRIALLGTGGGQPQLYVASAGLLAGLVWLGATATGATAAGVRDPVPGLVFGLLLGTVTHLALGTFDLTWRGGVLPWVAVALAGLAFLACLAGGAGAADDAGPESPGAAWFLVGPALLLWAMVGGSPALSGAALSYAYGEGATAGPGPGSVLPNAVLVAAAAGLLAGPALLPPPRRLGVNPGAVALVAGTSVFAWSWGQWTWIAVPLVALGLGLLLGSARVPSGAMSAAGAASPDTSETRRVRAPRGYAVVGGMTVFAVAAVLYYAAYDIGYPNAWVPVAVAVLVTVVVARPASRSAAASGARSGLASGARSGPPSGARPGMDSGGRFAVAAVVFVTFVAGIVAPANVVADDALGTTGRIRVVAYNIRMGFGLDGRFDLDGLVRAIADERPDVVLLSEVDRAWLLNGGHDTLALISRRLRMPYVFAPAADAVWGDAVLTRLPLVETRTLRLSREGAPTGAQALGVVVDAGGRQIAVVSTHLQPPPGGGPVTQAREVVRFAREFAGDRPLIVGGDLNTQPGDTAFAEFTAAGLLDGLAAARPLPTSPADAPAEQIDHILLSPGITVSDIGARRTTASDHLPVAATLTLSP